MFHYAVKHEKNGLMEDVKGQKRIGTKLISPNKMQAQRKLNYSFQNPQKIHEHPDAFFTVDCSNITRNNGFKIGYGSSTILSFL